MQLRGKINDLQREITNKTWGMDRKYLKIIRDSATKYVIYELYWNLNDAQSLR